MMSHDPQATASFAPRTSKKFEFARIVALACFAVWIGGFTFYASVVVPIGTDVLGSKTTQGLITQRVTNVLNIVCSLTLIVMAIEAWWSGGARSRRTNLIVGTTIGVIALGLIALACIHPILDGEIDVEHEGVQDEPRFYGWHRVYLWVSTLQWLAGWCWLIAIHANVRPSRSST